jgi:DNA polymerase-1
MASTPKQDKDILLLIDSYALIHRAFHAFTPDLTTSQGELVNAVYGFARLLLEVIFKFNPRYVIAAMDDASPTVRHSQFGQYKANRKPTDDALSKQIPRIQELLKAFDIPILQVPGYEADDIIGTLDARHSGPGQTTIIVTGDRDLFQLVDENTFVYLAGSAFSQSKLFDAAGVKEKMGLLPEQIVDLKSLQGDASDNIPGVAGIGEKGAVQLLQEFETLEKLYANLDKVPNRYKNKLENSLEIAKVSQSLATIIREVPMAFDFKDATFGSFDIAKLQKLFAELEFRSLQPKLIDLNQKYSGVAKSADSADVAEPIFELPVSIDAAEWQDQDLGKQVYLYHQTTTEADPLHWQLQKLWVATASGDKYQVAVNEETLAKLAKILLGTQVITSEAKCLIHALANTGVVLDVDFYDLALATYVCSAGLSQQSLTGVAQYYKLTGNQLEILALAYDLQTKAIGSDQIKDIVAIENKLIPTVAAMERNGVMLDVKLLERYASELETLIRDQAQAIYHTVGHEFNIASPKQVGEILFGELSLPGSKKTKTGGYSTDERILREIAHAHPVVEQILTYRELTKLQSTYVKPLPTLVNPKTKRLHANFRQLGAVTGRFASINPNLQNIPVSETGNINMRKAFVAAEGYTLIAFDYSQQELRILAELSGEENMQAAFKSGNDIHAATASEIFDIPIAQVTKEQRRIGKTINFGVVYGISAFGLADRLKIDQHKAAEFIKKYFVTYPKIKAYYQNLLEQAKKQGYAETLFGRRRNALELTQGNSHLRAAVEREIMNFPLQGSAADIVKQSMIAIADVAAKYPAKLILQVHDELVFEYECPAGELTQNSQAQNFIAEIQTTMLNIVHTEVPLGVGVEHGANWADMQDWPTAIN